MCISPLTLADGAQTACHECWQCREQAINDWVGRNIAESKTALWSRAVTLTYGRGHMGEALHERAVILTYSDVQKYLKLLRRHGFPVRYFVTGEYGTTKGRAHWHIMLYGQGKMPEHQLDRHYMEEHWPHGFSFWTKPTPHAVRYNCKYIQKGMADGDAERQGHLAMSKKPPLGAAYFATMAADYVAQGLAPQTLEYRFPDVTRRKSDGSQEVVPFMLKGKSAELFLDAYVSRWERERPRQAIPASELVENWIEYRALTVPEEEAKRIEFLERRAFVLPNRLDRPPRPKFGCGQTMSWMRHGNIKWNEALHAWVAPDHPALGGRLRWTYVEEKGKWDWRKIRETKKERA